MSCSSESNYYQVFACVEHHRHSPKDSSPPATPTPHKRNTSTDLNGAGTLFPSIALGSYPLVLEFDSSHRETDDVQAALHPQHSSGSEHNQHHVSNVTPPHSVIEDTWGIPKRELNLVKPSRVAKSDGIWDTDDQQQSSPSTSITPPDSPIMNDHHVQHGIQVFTYNDQAPTLTEASHPLTTNAPSMVTTNDGYQRETEDTHAHTNTWFLDQDQFNSSYKSRRS